MHKLVSRLLFLSLLVVLGIGTVSAQDNPDENPFGDPAEANVAVTVYNQGTALVRDRRTFDLTAGVNTVNFTDVASSIDATSVSFVSLTDPENTFVLEQNYVYDLVDTNSLLRRFIDQQITVTTSQDTVFTGILLSAQGDVILQDANGAVTVIRSGEIRDIQVPALPDGLITRPTLRWLVFSPVAGSQDVELTYLTGGISWSADYNVLLSRGNATLDLNGWVTLNNTSGTAYEDAQLKLIAGDVNRVTGTQVYRMEEAMMFDAAPVASAPPSVEQRDLFEYKLYEIGRTVTIGNNETKQIEFVTGANVPANTFYVYDGSEPFYGYYNPINDRVYGFRGITTVQTYLEFTTDEENGLGADLPAGRIRVYQQDVDGAALLIGENYIDHTPEGEEISLFLGNAFDLVGERSQQEFELISNNVLRETIEVRIRNRKTDETVEVRIPERLVRWSNWEILDSSAEYTQLDAATIEFRVDVPPGEEVVLTYTVQYSWPSGR
jgi:hypothetical protein